MLHFDSDSPCTFDVPATSAAIHQYEVYVCLCYFMQVTYVQDCLQHLNVCVFNISFVSHTAVKPRWIELGEK